MADRLLHHLSFSSWILQLKTTTKTKNRNKPKVIWCALSVSYTYQGQQALFIFIVTVLTACVCGFCFCFVAVVLPLGGWPLHWQRTATTITYKQDTKFTANACSVPVVLFLGSIRKLTAKSTSAVIVNFNLHSWQNVNSDWMNWWGRHLQLPQKGECKQ